MTMTQKPDTGATPDAEPAAVESRGSGRVVRPSGGSSIRDVLRNHAFLRLWLAQALSQIGQNMINFTLLLQVRDIVVTHHIRQQNIAISLVILAFSLPSLLLGPLAGVAADRTNRRTLMTIVNVIKALATALFLLIQPTWQAATILGATYLATFILGSAGQFFAPAEGSTIPDLVPRQQLISANALFNLTFTSAQLIGFATVGPLLVKLIGIHHVFELTVVLFLIAAGLVRSLPPTPRPEKAGEALADERPMKRLWDDIREGLVFILQDPILMKAIAQLTITAATFLTIASLGPAFVVTVVGLPKEDIGFIVAPAGLGVLTGVLVVGKIAQRYPRQGIVDWAMTLAGIMLLCIALAPDVLNLLWLGGDAPVKFVTAVVAAFAALLGLCDAFILVPSQTMLQERSHDENRARVYATFFTISNAVSFIPIFFAAAAADYFGVVEVLVIVSLLVALFGAAGTAQRRTQEHVRQHRVRTRHREGPETLTSRKKIKDKK